MIPMVDLKKQYDALKEEIDAAIKRVIENTSFILGPEVSGFEKEMANYLGVKYAVGVSSGTSALEIALFALGIGQGDEVLTTPFTFIATSEAIVTSGAKPVFVDIDPETYALDVNLLEAKINDKTKAILPVHLYGHPAEMDKILALAEKYNLKVIEDCAQALGAEYKGKKVGTIGDVGCLSFFPSKSLGCFGDGGMVVTSNQEIAEKAKMLRQHGSNQRYLHKINGFNSRLDAIQASILRVKLKYLDRWNKRRNEIASLYNELLAEKVIAVHAVKPGMFHCFNYYTIRVANRDVMQKKLKDHGIASMIYYPVSLHLQETYKGLGYSKGDFPEAEKAQQEVLSLPIYPELSHEQIQEVAERVKRET